VGSIKMSLITRTRALVRLLPLLAACALTLSCTGATTGPWFNEDQKVQSAGPGVAATAPTGIPPLSEQDVPAAPDGNAAAGGTSPEGVEIVGSGDFINTERANWTRPDGATAADGTILNFEAADVREVIKTVLGNILDVNYSIDPEVTGKITLHTSNPLPRDAIIPALESVLRSSGIALVKVDGIYKVVPEAHANSGGVAPSTRIQNERGYQHLIIPLNYVSAKSMLTVLDAVKPEKAAVTVDGERNMLLASGTEFELESIRETVKIYDVNQLKGMSIGMYPVKYSDATTIATELRELFGDESSGLVAGMVRIMSIDRLNLVSVITPQEEYLAKAQDWIVRLDQGTDSSGRSMYTYPVEHRRAGHLAELLTELFAEDDAEGGGRGSGPDSPSPTQSAGGGSFGLASGGSTSGGSAPVKLVSDERNNSLLILATRSDYTKIRMAIRQMDVLPMQVLIEASIMEVQLSDELSYGLQWFFKNNFNDGWSGAGELFPLGVDPSFTYTLFDSNGAIRAVLDLLAADSRLQVVSSPSLLVQDNHSATIKVGDEVPIRTSESSSLATSGISPVIASEIEYRETGVMLEVTPRVNAGGLVTLEITQEVNGVNETTTSDIDSPTIFQRSINTQVALASGETLYLGGLINEAKTVSATGIPGLRNIPWLGALFGSKSDKTARTELLVTITATAIADKDAARSVTEEMRRKMPGIFDQGTMSPPRELTEGEQDAQPDAADSPSAESETVSESASAAVVEESDGVIEGDI
jgi:general secretion pathway protein D